MAVVEVRHLDMTFQAPVRPEGLRAAAGSLFRREYRKITAVEGIDFSLEAGEVVAFLGPNGAGKTTTLKMLSGILHPTGGSALVLGHVPWRRETGYLRQIAMVRGSRPLSGPTEVTVHDALRFQQLVYDVPKAKFDHSLRELREMLELEPLLDRQVRALSLGERMRAGLAMSLVYRPKVLFLDEPTVGLDVSAVTLMRQFIAGYARQSGATILLTSHYMADVDSLCERVLLIDKGTLRYDGSLANLSATLAPFKLVEVDAADSAGVEWAAFGDVVEVEGSRVRLRVTRDATASTITRLLRDVQVSDLSVVDPPLEHVIDRAYREGVA
ncbi:MAG TPA: ATP-binding cassette domain-containing protein [Thermomicrobiales bacterium]|nr:ATP-binding cassette domain-containing protein [Thermomicrobiales bacterium]